LTTLGIFSLASLVASLSMFNAALGGVLRSPASFFDTTPMGISLHLDSGCVLTENCTGRILSRLSKDQDTLDNELSIIIYQVSVILVFWCFTLSNLSLVALYV
jgi:ATP-binding cassette subfamily C (CFTR/MRP) protein 1